MKKAIISADQTCDLCKEKLTRGVTFSDASVSLHGGSWCWLCHDCAREHGVRYGTGLGQKYDSETLEKIEG